MVGVKRQAETSDDEEEVAELLVQSNQRQASGPSTKRARVNGNDENDGSTSPPELTRLHPETSDDEDDEVDELATPAPSVRGGPNKDGPRANGKNGRVNQDIDMDVEASEDDEDDDDADGVRQTALNGRNQQEGVIAEAGVVDTVVLKNFMCHRHMEIKLHPQINFIIGHNGSGKSVILTGLAFAFGTKAALTSRGKSLKDLIKDKGPSAEVIVSLRNKGAEAYKPEIYGNKIYITRRITSEGSSNYKIAGSDRKTISTKRNELAAICDYFQIQVDNPVNILHQDNAKLFLHSSKPQDKYRFFLKGTQLEQLSDEYQEIWEKCQYLKQEVRTKKDRLEELKTNMKEAHAAWKDIEKAKNVENTIRDLKHQLAWTHVVDIEKQAHEAAKALEIEADKVAKAGKRLREAQRALDEANAKFAETQAQQEQDGELEDLEAKHTDLYNKQKAKIKQIREIRNDMEEMKSNVVRLQSQVKQHDRDLVEAQKQTDDVLRAQLEEQENKLRNLDAQKANIDNALQASRDKLQQAETTIARNRPEFEGARQEQDAARRAMDQADSYLRNLQASQQNGLNVYGQHAAAIVAAIDRDGGWRQRPVGPIGTFVKLKDPKWKRVLEDFFGETLNGFICYTGEDKVRLQKLIRRFNGARHNVYTVTNDPSFEAGLQAKLPDPTAHRTILNVLTIEPIARQAVIDITHCESTALVTESETKNIEALLRRPELNQSGITTAFTEKSYRLGGLEGGSRSMAQSQYRGPPRLSQDVEAERVQAQQAKHEAEQQLSSANAKRSHLDRLLADATAQKKAAEGHIAGHERALRRISGDRERLVEAAGDVNPPDIQALQQARAKAQAEIETTTAQGKAAEEQITVLQQETAPIVEEREAVAALLAQREEIRKSQKDVLENLITIRTTKEHEVAQLKVKEQQYQAKFEAENTKIDGIGRDLAEATAQAEQICNKDNVHLTGKTVKKLEREISSLEKVLREQEKQMGGSSEEVHNRYIEAKKVYEDNDNAIRSIKACSTILLNAYQDRIDRWVVFRQHIALRARMLFIRFLSQRGYSGDLRFRFEERKLELRVIPIEDADKDKVRKSKDASTLSGGEKSFSTICLLLALWHAAGCPIRGLDEYDVFMDAVNRRIATKMLIDAGKAANNTQMILISPQAIQLRTDPTHVKIHRIADPERGQGTLSTNATG